MRKESPEFTGCGTGLETRLTTAKPCSSLIVVVIYKQLLLESSTIDSLCKCRQFLVSSLVLIWDNSLQAQSEDQLTLVTRLLPHVEYHHSSENLWLSKIYNRVIQDYFKESRSNFYPQDLILFDQDSSFDETFFVQLALSKQECPDCQLFLPTVMAPPHLISPADLYYFKGSYWKKRKFGQVRSRFHTAINSGMVISSTYLKTGFVGYDERLAFYGTDNYFMKQYAKSHTFFYVCDYVMQHKLSKFQDEELETKLHRFRETIHAIKIINDSNVILSLLAQIYCFLYATRQAIKFRDMRFLQF